MERFNALADDAIGFTGDYGEFNDPDTSANVIGSGPELGGVSGEVSSYDSLDDDQVINLTGASETPMVADDEPLGSQPNPSGAGSAGPQLLSRVPDPQATDQVQGLVRSGFHMGSVLARVFGAPEPQRGDPVFVQTSQAGISLHANLVLFFILGVVIALIVLPE